MPLPSSAKGAETWATGNVIPAIAPELPPIPPTRNAYSPSSRFSIRTAVTATEGASASGVGAGSIAAEVGALVLTRPRFAAARSAGWAAAKGSSSAAVVVLITEILTQLTRCYPVNSKMPAFGQPSRRLLLQVLTGKRPPWLGRQLGRRGA